MKSTVLKNSGAQSSKQHTADPSWVSFFGNWKNGSSTSANDNNTSTRRKKVRKGAAGDDGPMADRIATRAQRLLVGAENATAAYKEVYVDRWHPTDNPQGKINLCTAENNLCDDLLHKKLEANADRLRPDAARISHYPVPGGYESTKEAVKRYLEHFHNASQLRTDFMILTPGCTAAYDMLSYVLCEPGDVVLSAAPFYGRLFNNFEERGQAEVIPVSYPKIMSPRLDIEPFESMKRQIEGERKRVKVIVVINPNNPLGVVFPKDQVINLCNWATSNQIHVVIDEVFASSVYEHANQFESFLSYRSLVDTANVSYIWGFSKDLCLPGLKFSLVYTESEHMIKSLRRLEIMQPCAPCVQHIAEVLLDDLAWLKTFHKEKNSRLRKNRNFVCAMLNKLRIDYVPCTAAFTVYVDLKRYMVGNSFKSELQLWLELCGSGVFISPGQFMGGSQPGWFRIVFSGERAALIEGLHRFEEALDQLSVKACIVPNLPRIDTNPVFGGMPSQLEQQGSADTPHPDEPEPTMKRELSGWDFGESRTSFDASTSPNRKKRVSWCDMDTVAKALERHIFKESDPTYQQRIVRNIDERRGSIDVVLEQNGESGTESGPTKAEVEKYDHSYIDQFIRKTSVIKTEIVEGTLKYRPQIDSSLDELPQPKPTIVISDFDASLEKTEPSRPVVDTSFIVGLLTEKSEENILNDSGPSEDENHQASPVSEEVKLDVREPEVEVVEDHTSEAIINKQRQPSQPVIDTSFIADLVAQVTEEHISEGQLNALDDFVIASKSTSQQEDQPETEPLQSDKQGEAHVLQDQNNVSSHHITKPESLPTIDVSFVADLISQKSEDEIELQESDDSLVDDVFVGQPANKANDQVVEPTDVKTEEDQAASEVIHKDNQDSEVVCHQAVIDTSFVADLISQKSEDEIEHNDIGLLDDVFAGEPVDHATQQAVQPTNLKFEDELVNVVAQKTTDSHDSQCHQAVIDTSFVTDLISQKSEEEVEPKQAVDSLLDDVCAAQPEVQVNQQVVEPTNLKSEEVDAEVVYQKNNENHDLELNPHQAVIDTSFIADLITQKNDEPPKETHDDGILDDVFAAQPSTKLDEVQPEAAKITNEQDDSGDKPAQLVKENVDLEIGLGQPAIDTIFVAGLVSQKLEEEPKPSNENLLDDVFIEEMHPCDEQKPTNEETNPETELGQVKEDTVSEPVQLDVEFKEPIDTSFIAELVAQKPKEELSNKKNIILDSVFVTSVPYQHTALPSSPTTAFEKRKSLKMIEVSSETYIDEVDSKNDEKKAPEIVQLDKNTDDVEFQPIQCAIDTSFITELITVKSEEVSEVEAPEKPARTFTETELTLDDEQNANSEDNKPDVLSESIADVKSKGEPTDETSEDYDHSVEIEQNHDGIAVIDNDFIPGLVAEDTVTKAAEQSKDDILSAVFEEPKLSQVLPVGERQEFESAYVEMFIANNPSVRSPSLQESPILLRKSNLVDTTDTESPKHPTKRLVHQDYVQIIRKKHSACTDPDDDLLNVVFPHQGSDSAESSDGEFRRLTLVHNYRPGLNELAVPVKQKLEKRVSISDLQTEVNKTATLYVGRSTKKVSISAMKPTCIGVSQHEDDREPEATVTDSVELDLSASRKDVDLAESSEYGRKVTLEEAEIAEKPSLQESSLMFASSGLIDTSFVQDMFKEHPKTEMQAAMRTSDDMVVKIFCDVPGEVSEHVAQLGSGSEEVGSLNAPKTKTDADHHAVPLREELNFIDNLVKAARRSSSFEEDTDIIEKVFSGMRDLKQLPETQGPTFTVTAPFDNGEEIFEKTKFKINSEVVEVPKPKTLEFLPEPSKQPRRLSKIASASDLSKKEKTLLTTEMARHQTMTPEDEDLLESVFRPSYSAQQSQVDNESVDYEPERRLSSAHDVSRKEEKLLEYCDHMKRQSYEDLDSLNMPDGIETPLPSRADDLQFEVPEESLLNAVFREQHRKLSEEHDSSQKEVSLSEDDSQEDPDDSPTPGGLQFELSRQADSLEEDLVADQTFSSSSTLEQTESASDESTIQEISPRIDVSFVEELVRHQNPHVLSPGAQSMDSGIVAPKKRATFDQSSSEDSFHKDSSSDSDSSVVRLSEPRRKPSKSLTNLAKFDDGSSESSSIRPNSPLNRAIAEYENLLNHVFEGSTPPVAEEKANKVKELHYRDDGFQTTAPETPKSKPPVLRERKLTITTHESEDSLRNAEIEEEIPHHDGFEHHAIPLEHQFGFVDELVKESKESTSFEEDHDIIEKVFSGMSSLKRKEFRDDCLKIRKIEPQFTLNISRNAPNEESSIRRSVVEIDPNDGLLDLVFSEGQKSKKKRKKHRSEGEVVVEKVNVTEIVYDSKSLPETEVEQPKKEQGYGNVSFFQSLLLNTLLVTLPTDIASTETVERVSSDPIYPFSESQDEDPCPTENNIYYHIVPSKDNPSELSMETVVVPKRLHLIQQEAAPANESGITVDSTTQTTHVLIDIETKDEAVQESAELREIGIQTGKHVGFRCQITVIPPEEKARKAAESTCQNQKHKKDGDHCQPQYRVKQSSMTPSEKILGKSDKLFMTKDKSLGQWVISAVCRSTPYGFERSSLAAKGYAPAAPLPDVIETTRK